MDPDARRGLIGRLSGLIATLIEPPGERHVKVAALSVWDSSNHVVQWREGDKVPSTDAA